MINTTYKTCGGYRCGAMQAALDTHFPEYYPTIDESSWTVSHEPEFKSGSIQNQNKM